MLKPRDSAAAKSSRRSVRRKSQPMQPPPRGGRQAGLLSESDPKGTLVGEANARGNRREIQITAAEQGLCPVDPLPPQPAVRRNSRGLLECKCKMADRQAADAGE